MRFYPCAEFASHVHERTRTPHPQLAEELKQRIPEGPPLFGNDVMSDKPQRFFAAEIIREQIFGCFSQEVCCTRTSDGRFSSGVGKLTVVAAGGPSGRCLLRSRRGQGGRHIVVAGGVLTITSMP